MRIAVDISPIDSQSESAHKVRGVGKYITLLKDNLERFDNTNQYIFTSDPQNVVADIVHYPYFDPFFITLPFVKKHKTIVTVHDLIPLAHKDKFPVGIRGNLKWLINKRLLKNVDGIITDSVASKDAVRKIVGFSEKFVFPVYLSADEDFRRMSEESMRAAGVEKKFKLPSAFFLYVGDVTWNKNLPRIVEAIKKVNIPLVMVGKALVETDYDRKNPWNTDRNSINREINSNPLFIKLGFVETDDLVRLYNSTIALVMPSIDEGFGLPVLEAMKCGCPVITSRLGSLPEVGGDAVLYVDAYSFEDIAEKMNRIATNMDLRSDFSKKSLVKAESFSLKKMVEDTVNSYMSI